MSFRHRSSIAVLGVPFDNVTMDEAVKLIEQKIDESGYHQVATANVDFIMHALQDKALQDVLCSCDLVVPDGMPIVWASRLMGTRLKERVSGADLVPHLAELSAKRGYGIFLLGASEENSRRAAEALTSRYPSMRLVGRYSPPQAPLEEMDHDGILARIEAAKPDILLVAMGHPKQEKWLAMHRHRLKIPLCMGVGGSLDFLAGSVQRAPQWMQKAGLEWFFRAVQEPNRLARRYFSDACGLARHLPGQVVATAIQPRKQALSRILSWEIDNARVVSVCGDITGILLDEFNNHLSRGLNDGRHIILDFANANYLGPDSVGSLLHYRTLLKNRRLQLWFVGVSSSILRTLRAAQVKHYFLTTSTISDAVRRLRVTNAAIPAGLAAFRGPAPSREVRVRVEMLKDVCERMIAAHHTNDFGLGGLYAKTSATH